MQTTEQIAQVHELGIPVEVCPSSNLCFVKNASNIISRMEHLAELVRLDHNIVICCDDTMLFSTN
jgi:adenosine deaminase